MLLAVDVPMVTLAVVAGAVGPLHTAASPRPTGVVVSATFQCSLAYGLLII